MKLYSKILIFFLFICLNPNVTSYVVKMAKITGFRFSALPNKTRLVFDATNQMDYTVVISPKKIIVDIRNAKMLAKLDKHGLNKTFVNSIVTMRNRDNLRLTFDLTKPVQLKHFLLSNPHRLIFDLYPETKQIAKEIKASPLDTASNIDNFEQELIDKLSKTSNKADSNIALPNNLREIVVVIDPGHGGEDPGAIGPHGVREKDITLAVARAMQNSINNVKGFHAILTRNSDHFIPLRQRLEIAHAKKADIFISIHADAYQYRDAYGASVFALSQRGATSEAARWLAEKENESELGQAISDKNVLLRSVLIDLAQTATISASLDIGNRVLRELGSFTSLHSRKVEQAAFVVLKSPDIPSLLVEVGFISYGQEEMKLRNSYYQKELAARLAQGIYAYFLKRSPQGTYLSTKKYSILGAKT